MLNIIDEYTRECLTIDVKRKITSQDVIDQLYELFLFRGIPEHIRSDNGPEFTAKVIRGWLNLVGVKTLFIEPGSPWENGYVESWNILLPDVTKQFHRLKDMRHKAVHFLSFLSSGICLPRLLLKQQRLPIRK